MNIKIGSALKKTAYAFYTLGVFFLITGMLLSAVTSPVSAYQGASWDKSSLSAVGSCQGDCLGQSISATVCNVGSGDMATDGQYEVYYSATGNPKPPKKAGETGGTLVPGSAGTFGKLPGTESQPDATKRCATVSFTPTEAGNYIFRFIQNPGHPGEGETWPDGYCTVSSDSCDVPDKTTLTVVKIVNNNYGGTKSVGDFALYYGVPGSSTNGVTSGVENEVEPGTYRVGEGPHDGYTQSIGGACAPDGSVTINKGENPTCVITNSDKPTKLTVVKIVDNNGGGTKEVADFALFIGTGPVTSGVANTVLPGSYVVSETNLEGYSSEISGACDSNGNVTLALGEEKTCTITNTYQPIIDESDPAYLTIIKHVINDNGGTKAAEDFNITLKADGQNDETFAGSETGVRYEFKPGEGTINFKVTEAKDAGYADSYEGCEGSLKEGDDKTCIITNDDIAPTLTVIKQVINDNEGTKVAGDFTMNVTNNGGNPISFPGVSGEGHTVSMNAGTYNVTETEADGYTAFYGSTCSGTLALAENKTCTIINDDVPPVVPPGNATLKVIKIVDGGPKTVADFKLYIDNKQVTSDVTNTVLPGSYVVSEKEDKDYEGTIGGDCDAQGNVTLKEGENKTCTITNEYIEIIITPHTEDPTPQPTLPAPQSTPSQNDPLIPVTGADLSHPGFPMAAMPRLAMNLGIALLGLAMVFHGASTRIKDEEE